MAQTYDQRRELLARLWEALWPALRPSERERLLALPDPCHNHLELRMRKEERARRLTTGCRRIAALDSELFLEGLRLHPHALSRAAETAGPLPGPLWDHIAAELGKHRLWQVGPLLGPSLSPGDEGAFWNAIETLEHHRELPQPMLDFLEAGRPRSSAPLEEFRITLARFLVRAKLERLRFSTYAALKGSRVP